MHAHNRYKRICVIIIITKTSGTDQIHIQCSCEFLLSHRLVSPAKSTGNETIPHPHLTALAFILYFRWDDIICANPGDFFFFLNLFI